MGLRDRRTRAWLVGPLAASVALGSLATGAVAQDASTIDFWHIQANGTDPQLIEQAVQRFETDNPGVTVDMQVLQNDAYKEKIKIATGAGEAPCVFPTWGGGPLYEYVSAGQVIDLTSRMDADGYKDRFVDASFTPITFDGKIYGVPVENTSMAVVLYNKEILDGLGLAPAATWDELLTLVAALRAEGIAPFALANQPKWPGSMYYMYLVDRLAGPSVFEAAATRTGGSFEDPAFIKAGELLQDLVKADAFAEGFNGLSYDNGDSRALLYSGQAAMELMGNWEASIIKGENPDFYPKLAVAPFPTVPDGTGDPGDLVGTAGDNFYSISSTCADPDNAFKLIQYLIDDESVRVRGEAGRIPPVKGFTSDDPLVQQIIDLIEAAPNVQLWYDQYLPPALGQVHLDTSQGLYALTITPEAAAKELEDAAKAYFGE